LKQKYHIIIEICLIVVIIAQFFSIRSIYGVTEDKIENTLSEMLGEWAKNKSRGKCYDDLKKLNKNDERKDYDAIIDEGNALLKNGYENDKYVLRTTALAYYKKGNNTKAIDLYSLSLKGKIACEIFRPNNDTLVYFDDAITHYILGIIYKEIGDKGKSIEEKEKALVLSELFYNMIEKNVGPDIIINHAESILGK
jgi:tetratricopeptide (TPR) repeat protein